MKMEADEMISKCSSPQPDFGNQAGKCCGTACMSDKEGALDGGHTVGGDKETPQVLLPCSTRRCNEVIECEKHTLQQCKLCHEVFVHKPLARAHVHEQHKGACKDISYPCKECDQPIVCTEQQEHYKQCHPGVPSVCYECGEIISDKCEKILYHYESHLLVAFNPAQVSMDKGPVKIACKKCGQNQCAARDMVPKTKSKKAIPSTLLVDCLLCSAQVQTGYKGMQHIQSLHIEDLCEIRSKCPYCDVNVSFMEQKEHFEMCHLGTPYVCPECSQMLQDDWTEAKDHYMSHFLDASLFLNEDVKESDKPYPKESDKSHAEESDKLHAEESDKPYPKESDKSHARESDKSHAEESDKSQTEESDKPHECTICRTRFETEVFLKAHHIIQHGQEMETGMCPYCNFIVWDAEIDKHKIECCRNLSKHRLKNRCIYCPLSFKAVMNLIQHASRWHDYDVYEDIFKDSTQAGGEPTLLDTINNVPSRPSKITANETNVIVSGYSCRCRICKANFSGRLKLSNHIQDKHRWIFNKTDPCKVCAEPLTVIQLPHHYRSHHKDKWIHCPLCDDSRQQTITGHYQEHFREDLVDLPAKDSSSNSSQLLVKEVEMNLSGTSTPNTPDTSSRNTPVPELEGTSTDLNIKVENEDVDYNDVPKYNIDTKGEQIDRRRLSLAIQSQCKLCKRQLPSMKIAQEHIRTEHQNDVLHCVFTCKYCDLPLPYNRLYEHIRECHPGMVAYCPLGCSGHSNGEQAMDEHYFLHFYDRHHQYKHGKRKAQKVPHRCTICDKGFANKKTYLYHMTKAHENNTDANKWECSLCQTGFDTWDKMDTHFLGHFVLNIDSASDAIDKYGRSLRYQCFFCKQGFRQMTVIRGHINSEHKSDLITKYQRITQPSKARTNKTSMYPCTVCQESLPNIRRVKEHTVNHFVEKTVTSNKKPKRGVQKTSTLYQCMFCQNNFHHQKDASRHIKTEHVDQLQLYSPHFPGIKTKETVAEKRIILKQQTKDFNLDEGNWDDASASSDPSVRIKQEHTDSDTMECNSPSNTYSTDAVHTPEDVKMEDIPDNNYAGKRCQCKLCTEEFSKVSQVRNHLKVVHWSDIVERKYKCTSCSNSVAYKEYYIHCKKCQSAGVKKKPCPVGCGMMTEGQSHCEQHYLTHFYDKLDEDDAVETKLPKPGKQPRKKASFKCPCGRAFTSKKTYQNHMIVAHTEDKQIDKPLNFSCSICQKMFDTYSKMDLHFLGHFVEDPHKKKRELLTPKQAKKHGLQYKCKICKQSFDNLTTTKPHIHKDHKMELFLKYGHCKSYSHYKNVHGLQTESKKPGKKRKAVSNDFDSEHTDTGNSQYMSIGEVMDMPDNGTSTDQDTIPINIEPLVKAGESSTTSNLLWPGDFEGNNPNPWTGMMDAHVEGEENTSTHDPCAVDIKMEVDYDIN